MSNQTMEWQIAKGEETESGKWHERFGERYGFTQGEKEVMRLYMLFGLEDREIMKVMQIAEHELEVYLRCLTGKTRTNTMREMQALFLRYLIQKLPS
ncbi:helix-turn-helix transcriptional regulator [Cohnella mopanensis]|uniref:helix-turn-helix transcriptional regulator n=1 Tax=Cohnella mopanensis TaxID=2911966 RepID=UPI001EF83863|nr:hypothetical protein [Cohnella mopanensis]